ncbi:MAG: TatD family hydrolase [Spirochaetota bacterium]
MSKKHKNGELHFELLPGMIDSHFHTAMMRKKGLEAESVISRALQAGMSGGVDIGIEAGDTGDRSWVHAKFPQIKLAAGLYPSEAEHENLADRLSILRHDLDTFPISAIGEIGIDLHWNYGTVEGQQELMQRQIELANRHRLPIIIHNREADREVVEVLRSTPPAAAGIMHCFSSDAAAAREFLDAGLYISFAGNLTYKKSEALRNAARQVPLDRLLAETDSPFLSPQKVRGKTNHPGHVGFVYYQLAELHALEVEELIQIISENFARLFP